MRTFPILGLFLLAALAGCTGRSLDCPDEYGAQFEVAYLEVAERLEEAGTPIEDADADCMGDAVEAAYGTDPDDPDSYPTLAQLADGADHVPGLGNATAPPAPAYVWKAHEIGGDVTTTQETAFEPTGALVPGGLVVPANAQRLFVNFTVTPTVPTTELTIRLESPACIEQNGCGPESPTLTTVGGVASFDLALPEDGAWDLVFFAETGVFDGSWTAEANALVPA